MKTIEIRIAPDGSISAQTQGFVGKSCMNAIPLLQAFCDGIIVQSGFTEMEQVQNYVHGVEEGKICPT